MKRFFNCLYGLLVLGSLSAQHIEVFSTMDQAPVYDIKIIADDRVYTSTIEKNIVQIDPSDTSTIISVQAENFRSLTIEKPQRDTTLYLFPDVIQLDDVVVTDFLNYKTDFFGLSATQVSQPLDGQYSGSAAALSTISGLFVDASLGDVFSRVYSRGVSASAEDDIGWYYTSLQEDGLPISSIQYNYFTPDMYHRMDLLTSELEVIKGGKSAILSQNTPGGIVNFSSTEWNRKHNKSLKTSLGLEGNGRLYRRVDGMISTCSADHSWSFAAAGFYRKEDGARDVDYSWNSGGQLRLLSQKNLKNGILRLSYKYLNDHVNRYTGVTATNWNNPIAAFDQNLNTTALMLPELRSTLPGGPYYDGDTSSGYDFDSSNGIHTKEQAARIDLDYNLSRWDIKSSLKYSKKSANWQSSFSNARVGLEDFLAYFVSGASFPFGIVSFRDARSKELLAVVDNSGALGPFSGQEASFSYLSGALPNDAIMGIAPWYKDDRLSETMMQLVAHRSFSRHDLSLGFFASISDLDYFTNASFAYSTFEADPRLLDVELQDFYGNTFSLSDTNGLSNYGGLFFENGNIQTRQYAIFANDQYEISDRWTLDIGARMQVIHHQGDLISPTDLTDSEVGADGDPTTAYDQSVQIPSDRITEFAYDYRNLSWSMATQYTLGQHQWFARISSAEKAPELNYYINNFSGEGAIPKGKAQSVDQLELGWKYESQGVIVRSSLFHSTIDNIAQSGFFLDQQTQEIFYNPIQFNQTVCYGVELSWIVPLGTSFSLMANHTIQRSNAAQYTVYQANGSADPSDDQILNYTDNDLPHTPSIMTNAQLQYHRNRWKSVLSISYMGARFGNVANSFELPSYTTLGLDITYRFSNRLSTSFAIDNMLNSAGLANFFGPNFFGGSANDASASYINDNPEGDFVVFPIMPRSMYISVRYDF